MAILPAIALLFQLSAFQQHIISSTLPVPVAKSTATAPADGISKLPSLENSSKNLPDAPRPVHSQPVEVASSAPNSNASMSAANASPEAAADALNGIYIAPGTDAIKPLAFKPYTSPVERSAREWLALSIAQHAAATFDAWTTRRSVASGNVEADPMLKPFVHSDAIYGAIQGTPLVFDFLSRRMQRSDNRIVRRFWWVPQTAMASVSIYCGAHNLAITR